MQHRLFLALGSNLGDRAAILASARRLISERIGALVQVSLELETEPVGFESEHNFLNQVVEVRTLLSPQGVLDTSQVIERELGRYRKSKGGIYRDRTCDIDIILYDDLILDADGLQIPHPRFRERTFVLSPMVELCPTCVDPVTGKTMEELLWDVF
ncbi:MAG: 2-amino-4-hydroxy-6-hydroxymethyldihydropteridine diphosphokinase [Porphyromonas sp.]|nr:2-amino-4-hydroxy-6-hydroxymethyldihydropteridine diphosphokinase [Porphyromonas sp.]